MKLSMLFKRLAFLAAAAACAFAQSLTLPAIFSDNVVLQAGKPIPVFGKAAPKTAVSVAFLNDAGQTVSQAETIADADGKWRVNLPALRAGTRGELRVETAKGESAVCANALVGEVWLCSGQSNMAFVLGAPTMTPEQQETFLNEVSEADGDIRQFMVKRLTSPEPKPDVVGVWQVLSPSNIRQCTAVGWNFAWRVFKETGAPVGLIHSSWGGTPVEAWLDADVLAETSVADSVRTRHQKAYDLSQPKEEQYKEDLAEFNAKYPTNAERVEHYKERPRLPYSMAVSGHPSTLYNAMIRGLEPYGIRGILWYQGEANAGRAQEYGELMTALVESWRRAFENPEAPFYYVELANFMKPQAAPVETAGWGKIREAQGAVLSLPNTGVATAVDVGMANDIHPTDKKTVGNRLAGMALNDIYGKPGLCRSPEYKSHEIKGDTIVVSLNYADGLRARNGEIEGFAVCGDDGVWVWAEETKLLPDGKVAVRSAEVKNPVAARYGWASNPVLSLENSAGLPLRPFRTDTDSPQ